MRRIALTLAFAALCTIAAAQSLTVQYGPWVTGVGENGFTVLWTTPERSLCQLEVAPDDGLDFDAIPRQTFVETIAGRNIFSTFHSVKVTGLEPGKAYRYRIAGQFVKDSSNPYDIHYQADPCIAARGSVKTLNPEASTCRFMQINDMHFDTELYSSLIEGKTAADMDFLLLNGDIVSYSNDINEVIRCSFDPAKELLKTVPVVYARGNHESRGESFAEVPKLFPSSTGEFYFQFRQGPVAFIVLDAGEDKPDQTKAYAGYAYFDQYRQQELEWLKTAVKDPSFVSAPLKVVLMHIPPFNDAQAWYTQRQLNANFVPVLNEAGIDIMICAHQHRYMLVEDGEQGNGFPIFVNSNVERLEFVAEDTPAGSTISISTYDAQGKALHGYAIKKRHHTKGRMAAVRKPGQD